ncbi:hypothetical protein FG386_003677 [Cryptosporidium ryanae]|uniref:uncharacterized protein n=1 Tax=Cryptosporidium ryanae TaxID=515981 RepID=UPI00351AAA41|nr:hypothetical protein FG386_003677 [Cryptosporidium ryanae]
MSVNNDFIKEYADFIQNYPINRTIIPYHDSIWTWIECNPENEYKKCVNKKTEINEELQSSIDEISNDYNMRNSNVKQLSPENLAKKKKNELIINTISGVWESQSDNNIYNKTELKSKNCSSDVKNDNDSLIILHGISGTAGEYFRLMKALLEKGYRVISVQYPIFNDMNEWCKSFSYFLEQLGLNSGVHLYGSDIGGLLGVIFSQKFPNKVKSLILCNSFLLTLTVPLPYMASTFLYICPKFVLIRLISEIFKNNNNYCYMPPEDIGYETSSDNKINCTYINKYDKAYNESFKFSINQLYSVSNSDLADRLNFILSSGDENSIFLSGSNISLINGINITFIATIDCSFNDQELYNNISKLSNFKLAQLKYGGDFPHISNHEDVALFCQIHLRNSGAKKYSIIQSSSSTRSNSYLNSNKNSSYIKDDTNKYYDMPYPGNIIHHESSFEYSKLEALD